MDAKLFFSCFSFYLLILPFCFNLATSTTILGNETDRIALLEFKAKIADSDDPLGVMSSWNNSVHFCHWHGVTCGRRHQRVTVLDLQSHKLAGSISPYIGNLSFLRELYLQNNSFSNGVIPPELGSLRRLQILHLGNNSLVGEIPANLTSCHNLVFLSLAYNQLEGNIPNELGSLRNLQVLLLYNNYLSGNIPSSFGNLSSLVQLSIGSNYLGGSMPSTLGQLKNLTFLSIAENRVVGTIPPSIFNLSSMEIFAVADNQLHGSLPRDMGFLFPNLQFFSIADNRFTGSIPASISNASNLVTLFLQTNNLTGAVPNLGKLHNLLSLGITDNHLGYGQADDLSFLSSLINATSLEILYINGNNFGGVLPESISNLSSKLENLLLDGNQIAGRIPSGIRNLKNLNIMEVWDNQLSGSIPEDIGKLQNLQILFLDGNQFTGNIPHSLGNLVKLTKLSLGRNKLQGSIPPSLGKCQNLLLLDLSDNNISGAIPSEIFTISSLSILLYLFRNHLTGALPMEVGNLEHLGTLDVSENMLSGEIPSSLGGCESLEELSMKGNYFHGTIPSSLSSLKAIMTLDLSHNNLSGQIPEFFKGYVLLQNLNLSFNNFSGMVPREGVFKNATATSIAGNGELCGGIPAFHLPACSSSEPKKRGLSHKLKFIISILLAVLGTFAAITFLLLCWLIKKRRETISGSSENLLSKVSYRTLLKATNGFSSNNLIGVGSFGSVYKGTLNSEEVFAVKVFNLQRRGASKSFIAECEALRNIRHRNLVKVITVCSSIDVHGNDFKALVYEFMVNGSLEEWLHPNCKLENSSEVTRKLNLLQRLNIAIDVACALTYLHNECHTPVVHCDLKPSNVLLDNEMTAHVGDFGLVKFLSEITDNFSTTQTSSTGVRGTFGYAAPEYGMGSEVSTYGDMYSFGILLLEMFSGKRPTDAMFNDNMNLHNYVKMALAPKLVVKIADPMLLEDREDDDSSCESLVSIFGIGIECSKEIPRERMGISAAAARLFMIRSNLIGNGVAGGQGIEYAATNWSSADAEAATIF